MESILNWSLSDVEKRRLIAGLAPELATLRTKADISQEALAELIGVSRQTYGAIERGTREMSWGTFLSLVLFYDCNQKTSQMLRSIKTIPQEIYRIFNGGIELGVTNIRSFLGKDSDQIITHLDEQAYRSIRTVILLEYARCTSTPGDVIVKSFDGVDFSTSQTIADVEAEKALRRIREQSKGNEQQ